MKKYRKIVWMTAIIAFAFYIGSDNVSADSERENYGRDYLTKIYNSENGLEGTAANCIYSSEDGFIWIGGYTGLYRYDGTEFKNYLIHGRALPVNEILQDQSGALWIGTNGEGLYRYDGNEFEEYPLNTEDNGVYIINKLYCDQNDAIWIGTKAGLFCITDSQNKGTADQIPELSGLVIQDICELETGEQIIIEKTGRLFKQNGSEIQELKISGWNGSGIPRCCSDGMQGCFYVGTDGSDILKLTEAGEAIRIIDGSGLSSFNEITEFQDGSFWVCSDSGIGILQDDEVERLGHLFNDSVEEVCTDYQGNFWFASSRQGVQQLYSNYFSNLGAYWNMRQTVNAIQWYKDKIYVGTDEGLYCYRGKTQIQDELVKVCRGERIRQLYLDQEERLWVSAYQSGIWILEQDGTISNLNTDNSGLTTNQIRCIWQKKNKEMLVGTEKGVFLIDKKGVVQQLVQDEILNTKRILDVKEDSCGTIYAATDGYGVFEIRDGRVEKTYAKQQGMLSGVILKIVPSERLNGSWLVTGEELCFLSSDGVIQQITELPAANSLDLLLTEDGDAIILAGNGLFRMKEAELRKQTELDYIQLNKQDGLPIDFTANSWNTIHDGILYMCGTSGVSSISLESEAPERPLRLYIHKITEDGQELEMQDGIFLVSSAAHRLNFDIRVINYVHQNITRSYFLKGLDQNAAELSEKNKTGVSYTNLKGGSYTYQYAVYDADSKECLAELSVQIEKAYTLWEKPAVRILLSFILAAVLILLLVLISWMRERHLKKKYRLKYLREKEEEISRMAFRDLVTGVYNRNCFEQDREKIQMQKIYALFSVSVNHFDYLKNKYGIRYAEKTLRRAAQILQECSQESLKIYRVSENGFFFWMEEPVQMEDYIYTIKRVFEKEGKSEETPLSFAVGAIYNNRVEKKTMDELIHRCWKMRTLDEKHAEARFIEGKMKFL